MTAVIEDRQIGSLAARLARICTRADTDTWQLTDKELIADVVEVSRARASIDELFTRLVGAADERDLARLAGATSTATWLKNLTGMSRAEAHRFVKRSEAMSELVEDTRRAWAAGTITSETAATICEAIAKLPDWVGDDERAIAQTKLLEWASRYSQQDLQMMANRIIEHIDPDGAEEHLGKQLEAEEAKAWGRTELSMFKAGDGMTRGRFLLPIVQAGMLKAVLEGLASPRRNDPRIYDRDGEHCDAANGTLTHNQKLGRSFCELIEHLPAEAMPAHGGLAATITVEIDFEALKNGLGTALLSTGDEMSASQARRFACNAQLLPIVMDGKSKILDLGLSKRLHSRYQRVAIAKRDKGCVWKGCDRPPAWCEVHHPEWWSHGGPTDLNNGALFCSYHHHLLHNGEWDCRIAADGVPEVIPPGRIDPQQRPIRHYRFNAGP